MAIPIDSLFTTINTVLIIAGIGVSVSAIEDLCNLDLFSDSGLLSWRVLKCTQPVPRVVLVRWAREILFARHGVAAQLVVKAGAGAGLVLLAIFSPRQHVALGLLCDAVLFTLVLFRRRNVYGHDGSDDMMMVTFVACAVFFASPPGSFAQVAATLYIAVQSGLSYLIAGVAKLASPSWRQGEAIAGILGTTLYGHATSAEHLRGRYWIGLIMCWSVIIFECIFVCALFVENEQIMYAILLAGGTFHASTAVLMGLNGFVWAFLATYPAVIFANDFVQSVLS